MRGRVERQQDLFFTMQVEEFVPKNHPLRGIKRRVDQELRRLAPVFNKAYSRMGRPSIPPETLIKASLLQVLYGIRSERQLAEQISYNMLFRWFLDMKPDDSVFVPTTFTKNRERFDDHGLMQKFFDGTVARGIHEGAMSTEHFSVDGSLIDASGSMKSFRPKQKDEDSDDSTRADSNGWADFKGKKRSNKTHECKTDPEARLMRKGHGKEARLSHSIHVITENRNGLIVDIQVDEASGTAERDAAESMLLRTRRRHRIKPKTIGADKGYDSGEFLETLQNSLGITPHVAIRDGVIKTGKSPGYDARRRARRRQKTKGYALSQIKRRLTEPVFGWVKGVAGLSRTPFVGRWKTQILAYSAAAAFNLLRMAKGVT